MILFLMLLNKCKILHLKRSQYSAKESPGKVRVVCPSFLFFSSVVDWHPLTVCYEAMFCRHAVYYTPGYYSHHVTLLQEVLAQVSISIYAAGPIST